MLLNKPLNIGRSNFFLKLAVLTLISFISIVFVFNGSTLMAGTTSDVNEIALNQIKKSIRSHEKKLEKNPSNLFSRIRIKSLREQYIEVLHQLLDRLDRVKEKNPHEFNFFEDRQHFLEEMMEYLTLLKKKQY
jgi:hypothetical protein